MFFEHVDPSLQLLKNGMSWHDLVTSNISFSVVSAISWKIFMKLIKNEADSTISDVK